MTAITNTPSLSITDSSRPIPNDFLEKKTKHWGSAACLFTGGLVAGLTGAEIVNVVAREILGLCDALVFTNGTQPYYPCADKWQKLPLCGSISLIFLTTGLAISYSPTVLEKIKSLSLFGGVKNSSETEPKGKGVDLLAPFNHLSSIAVGISAIAVADQFIESLSTISKLVVTQLSGTCITEIVIESNETIVSNHCKTLIENGSAQCLATILALTALGASLASQRLIGKVRKLANKN